MHLTLHHGIRLGQPRPNNAGLLFGGMKGSLGDTKVDLELAIFLSRLRIMVLSRPPLSKETPGVVAVVRVGGIRRRGQRRGCSIRGLAGPGKRMKTVIHNEPINESEQFIVMNRRCQSHLMHRRHWFTGLFYSRISFAARLPQLSSPVMKLIRSTGKEEGCNGVLRGRRSAKEQERLLV